MLVFAFLSTLANLYKKSILVDSFIQEVIYENPPNLCLLCGRLGDLKTDCSFVTVSQDPSPHIQCAPSTNSSNGSLGQVPSSEGPWKTIQRSRNRSQRKKPPHQGGPSEEVVISAVTNTNPRPLGKTKSQWVPTSNRFSSTVLDEEDYSSDFEMQSLQTKQEFTMINADSNSSLPVRPSSSYPIFVNLPPQPPLPIDYTKISALPPSVMETSHDEDLDSI